MQITLKQTEIVEALKMYVQRQGLSLAGKTVEVNFTASRGNTGLLADMNIEEIGLPSLQQTDLDFVDGLRVIPGGGLTPVTPISSDPAPVAPVQAAPAPLVADPTPEAKAATSLFG